MCSLVVQRYDQVLNVCTLLGSFETLPCVEIVGWQHMGAAEMTVAVWPGTLQIDNG